MEKHEKHLNWAGGSYNVRGVKARGTVMSVRNWS